MTPSTPDSDRAAAIQQMRDWFDDPPVNVDRGRCFICTAATPSHQPGCPTLPAHPSVLLEARHRVDLFMADMDDWLRGFGDDVSIELWDALIRAAIPRRSDAEQRERTLTHYLGLLREATA